MRDIRHIAVRLYGSSVAWYWAFNGLRLAAGILVLPLLLRLLPKDDLGMYYVFLSIAALTQIIDFGFSQAIGRFVSYAMGGAAELKAMGMAPSELKESAQPNYALIWELLYTTRSLYRFLALAALVVLGAWGSYLVGLKVHESFSPTLTWWAWAITLAGAVFEIYANWWNNFLLSMNRVTVSARIGVVGYSIRLVISCVLLLLGCGLLSVPLASFFGSAINRGLSRRHCLGSIGPPPPEHDFKARSLLRVLWPTSWRLGVYLLSGYFRTNANTAICAAAFGLAATAEYGLSMQVIGIAMGMASVWTHVKWPVVGQLRARQDYIGLRKMLWPRVWLQLLTFVGLAAIAILWGPGLLKWFGSKKELLPEVWMMFIAFNTLLELPFSFWTTLILTENRLPFLWPTVATNILGLLLSLVFVHFTSLGVGGLILGPLLPGILFNYWYWPLAGAKSIRTHFLDFMFVPPRQALSTRNERDS